MNAVLVLTFLCCVSIAAAGRAFTPLDLQLMSRVGNPVVAPDGLFSFILPHAYSTDLRSYFQMLLMYLTFALGTMLLTKSQLTYGTELPLKTALTKL